jgi:hypothetical protein
MEKLYNLSLRIAIKCNYELLYLPENSTVVNNIKLLSLVGFSLENIWQNLINFNATNL